MAVEERKGDWCQTFTGKVFYAFDPRPEDVCDEDIAHALALQCRFGGHCSEFYSVAEHSLRVSCIVPPELALVGLLHDAAEAYIVDLPRPIKRCLPDYVVAEKLIAGAIGVRYGVELVDLPPEIKHADQVLLATEKRDLMPNVPKEWEHLPPPLESSILPFSWGRAKEAFLDRLNTLTDNRLPHDPRFAQCGRCGAAFPGDGGVCRVCLEDHSS